MLLFLAIDFDSALPWLIVAGTVAAGIAVRVIAGNMERRRTAEMEAAALQIGFRFVGEQWDEPEMEPPGDAELFSLGSSRKFRNAMIGNWSSYRVGLFDYQYSISHGKGSSTYRQTVVSFRKTGAAFPDFEMKPEGVMERLSTLFKHEDIDFDSHPEFSRRYLLRGENPDAVRELFNANLLGYLEGLDISRKWHVEGLGPWLMVYRIGKRAKPSELTGLLQETSAIAEAFFASPGAKMATFQDHLRRSGHTE